MALVDVIRDSILPPMTSAAYTPPFGYRNLQMFYLLIG